MLDSSIKPVAPQYLVLFQNSAERESVRLLGFGPPAPSHFRSTTILTLGGLGTPGAALINQDSRVAIDATGRILLTSIVPDTRYGMDRSAHRTFGRSKEVEGHGH